MLRAIAILFILTACTDGNGGFASGHQVGIIRSNQIVDIGNYRIEVADMRSARNFPIPETRHIAFSWSPSGYQRIFNENRWRVPTDDDWENFIQLRLKAADLSRDENLDWIAHIDRRRAKHERSDYKMRVREDGFILRDLCSGTVSGRQHCAGELTIQNDEKMRLAQQALLRFDPGCTLGDVDPPTVTTLHPNYKSRALSLVVEVICE